MTNRPSLAVKHLAALGGFILLTVLYTWPVAARFSTHALGIDQDAAFWQWWMWHFRHYLTELHANPLWSSHIYWPYGANLILQHGWTYAVEGFFLLKFLSLIETFNLLMLSNFVLAGYGVFLLAFQWGAGWPIAFVAGASYAFAPTATFFINGGVGFDHLSLQVMPFFLWTLMRAVRTGKIRDAVLAALALTWTWGCDYYFFLLCVVLIPVIYCFLRKPVGFSLEKRPQTPWLHRARLFLNFALAADALWLLYGLRHGQREFHGAGSMQAIALYVLPYMAFWGLLALRLAASLALRATLNLQAFGLEALRPFLTIGLCYAAMNIPIILSVLGVMSSGEYGSTSRAWRGGGNPTDIGYLIRPALYHPLWGEWMKKAFNNNSYSLFLGFTPLAAAVWLWRRRPRDQTVRLWYACGAVSLLISLGPWLKIFGVHTYLLLPFYFLHLLPIFDNIQTGYALVTFAAFFLSLILAAALKELASLLPQARARWVAPAAFALIAFEFMHVGIPNHDARVPDFYRRLGRHPEGAMLPVPVGACFDGISATGFLGGHYDKPSFQTEHRKPIVGGLTGRMPRRVYDQMREDPFLKPLLASQAGAPISKELADASFIRRYFKDMRLRYVLVYKDKTPKALQDAIARWPVALLEEDSENGLRLYAVRP